MNHWAVRIHLRLLESLIVAVAMTALAGAPVSAQTAVAQSTVAPSTGDQPLVLPPFDGGAEFETPLLTPQVPMAAPCPTPGYWVISTRNCPDDCCPACSEQCIEFFYATSERCARRSSMGEFLGTLEPGVPLLFVVHGSWVSFEGMMSESDDTWHWVRRAAPDQPLHVIFFTWASDDHLALLPAADMIIHGNRSERDGARLARLISHVPSENPICLLGHSHGARLIVSSLHLMAGGRIADCCYQPATRNTHRVRAVLAAAALEHHWMNPGERYGCALYGVECVVNFTNRHDLALSLYPLHRPLAGRALGKTGFTRSDRAKLGWLNPKAQELDVTPLIHHRHIWPNYFAQPALARSIAPIVYFPDRVSAPTGGENVVSTTNSHSAPSASERHAGHAAR